MARVYKTTDRVPVKIGDITVKIAPLSLDQKNEIQEVMIEGQKKNSVAILTKSTLLAVKMCVKEIAGLKSADDSDYQLEFEDDKKELLTDNCISDLMNMEESANLMKVCAAFITSIPKKFELDGVEIIKSEKKS